MMIMCHLFDENLRCVNCGVSGDDIDDGHGYCDGKSLVQQFEEDTSMREENPARKTIIDVLADILTELKKLSRAQEAKIEKAPMKSFVYIPKDALSAAHQLERSQLQNVVASLMPGATIVWY